MKEITKAWLKSAQMDLDNISLICNEEHLTPVIAFHSQQAIEKSFKALLEERQIEFRKTHDLLYLYKIIEKHFDLGIDIEMLKTVNELYIDSRYPGEFGLLPSGSPKPEEAKKFYDFAIEVFEKIRNILDE